MTIDELIEQAKGQEGLNVELLLKTAKQIRDDWRGYDQSVMVVQKEKCGTVACLAGEFYLAAGLGTADAIAVIRRNDVFDLISEFAGLPDGHELFASEADGWPKPYRERFRKAMSRKEEAMVCADMLEAAAAGTVTL